MRHKEFAMVWFDIARQELARGNTLDSAINRADVILARYKEILAETTDAEE